MLALVTPTRRRWPFLIEQARAIAPQLADRDLWIIGGDNEYFDDAKLKQIEGIVPRNRLAWVRFEYWHESNVNRLRNSLAAFAPWTHDIVECDDHDPLAPYALAEIRHALDSGYDYVFGWHEQRVQIESGGEWEQWPTVERSYEPGDFAAGKIDAIAVRAIRRSLWDKVGGWSDRWPGGDKDLATRAEALGAAITCLPRPLCTVTVDPSGIMGMRNWPTCPHPPSPARRIVAACQEQQL
jgi:hypothetical protein